jgi:hypothetical protein
VCHICRFSLVVPPSRSGISERTTPRIKSFDHHLVQLFNIEELQFQGKLEL